jgi:hypothetical protein
VALLFFLILICVQQILIQINEYTYIDFFPPINRCVYFTSASKKEKRACSQVLINILQAESIDLTVRRKNKDIHIGRKNKIFIDLVILKTISRKKEK